MATLVALAAGACSGGSDFDREAAIEAVVTQGQGTITHAQAECYVDRVRDEVGVAPLAPDYVAPPDVVPRLTGIRIDCIGVANLGTMPPVSVDPADLSVRDNLPQRRGDDPALDALWDACAATGGQACDDLFDRAPVGSDYETFGSTCGDRVARVRCAEEPAAGATTTTPSVSAPSTTAAP